MAANWTVATAALLVLWLAVSVGGESVEEEMESAATGAEESVSHAMHNAEDDAQSLADWASNKFSEGFGTNKLSNDQNSVEQTTKDASSESADGNNSAAQETSKEVADKEKSGAGRTAPRGLLQRMNFGLGKEKESKNAAYDDQANNAYDAASHKARDAKDQTDDAQNTAFNKANDADSAQNAALNKVNDAKEEAGDDYITAFDEASNTNDEADNEDYNGVSDKANHARTRTFEFVDVARKKISPEAFWAADMEYNAAEQAKDETYNAHETSAERINEAMNRAARMIRVGKRTVKDKSSDVYITVHSKGDGIIKMTTDEDADAKGLMANKMARWIYNAFNTYEIAKAKVEESLFEIAKERV